MEENQENAGQNNEAVVDQPVNNQQQDSPDNGGYDGTIAALRGLVSDSKINEILKESKNLSTNNVDNNEGASNEEGSENNEAVDENQNQDPENKDQDKGDGKEKKVEKKDDNKSVDDKKNILGINKNKAVKTSDIQIDKFEQIPDVIKQKFGQDIKEAKDLPKFFETAQKWRADSQALEKVKEENSDYKGLLESQPPEIIEAMKLHAKGEDFTKAFTSRPKFDFSKDAAKQNPEDLVNHYFPNKFTPEDFKEDKPSPALEIAISASMKEYNSEKVAKDNQTRLVYENVKKSQETFANSVASSVSALSQDFPDVDQDSLNEIEGYLKGGPQQILSLFMNKDGTMNKDAAKRILMAKHGESQIEYMMGLASNITETRTNEEILSRGADKPGIHKKPSGNKTQEIDPEIQKRIDEVKKTAKKKTFS